MGDLFILSSVSTIKRYSSCIDMTLPIQSDLRDSNHSCSLGLDTSPNCIKNIYHNYLPCWYSFESSCWALSDEYQFARVPAFFQPFFTLFCFVQISHQQQQGITTRRFECLYDILPCCRGHLASSRPPWPRQRSIPPGYCPWGKPRRRTTGRSWSTAAPRFSSPQNPIGKRRKKNTHKNTVYCFNFECLNFALEPHCRVFVLL